MAKGTLIDIHIVLYPLNCMFFVDEINIFHNPRKISTQPLVTLSAILLELTLLLFPNFNHL